jgi:hypothetical protein
VNETRNRQARQVLTDLGFDHYTWNNGGGPFQALALDLQDGRYIHTFASAATDHVTGFRLSWVNGPHLEPRFGILAYCHVRVSGDDLEHRLRYAVEEFIGQVTYPARHPEAAETFWTLVEDRQLPLPQIVEVCEQLAIDRENEDDRCCLEVP